MTNREGWRTVTVAEIADKFFGGGTPSRNRADLWDGPIPWTTSAEITGPRLASTQRRITKAGLASSATALVPAGNLLIGTRVGVGKACVNEIDVAINQDLTAAIVKQSEFDALFLAYALAQHSVSATFQGAKRGATIKGIPREDLLGISFSAPRGLDEQRRIAAFLAKLQRRVETERERARALAALKSATLAKLFRKGLRGEPLKDSPIGPIPQSWAVSRVGELCEIRSGGTPSKRRPDYWLGTVPWLSTKDMKTLRLWDTADHINERAANAGSRLAPTGTVFVGVRGMALAKAIPIALALTPMAFNQDVKALLPRGGTAAAYLLYAVLSRTRALMRAVGTSAHGTRKLAGSAVADLLIPVAGRPEQDQIATALNGIDEAERLALRSANTTSALFQAALQRLMTGELRIPAGAEKAQKAAHA